MKPKSQPNFDLIARPYRWLEYLTLGRSLERCRLHFLPRLLDTRRALVLGDGDGRFLARLLTCNPDLRADAVDLSPAMLHLLRQRSQAAVRDADARLQTHIANALTFEPHGLYDLVITHFFLDCLTQPELDQFATGLVPHLAPSALWLVSDFRVPPGAVELPARTLVRLLYLTFRLLTGLRTTRLPDHASTLGRAGLNLLDQRLSFGGILTTEIWQHHPPGPLCHLTGPYTQETA